MFGETLPLQMISDGAVIIGWVAAWPSASVFLLELWPVRNARRLYERIAAMEIVLVPS
jgi:hypothetical protein